MNEKSCTIAITTSVASLEPMPPNTSQHATWVARAGGVPVPLPRELASIDRFANERFAGLILTGGGDIAPEHYGGRADLVRDVDPLRDQVEFALVRHAYAAKLPIFAICRGVQVENVAFGGTLIEDIPTYFGAAQTIRHQQRRELGLPNDAYSHDVHIDPASTLHGILGVTSIRTNSMHHQAIGTVAPIFRVAARAGDGIIEAIEVLPEYHPFFIGVQWHPESFADDANSLRLYQAFVDACSSATANAAHYAREEAIS